MNIKNVFNRLTSNLSLLRLAVFVMLLLAVLLIIETATTFIIPMIPGDSLRTRYLLNLFAESSPVLLGFIASVLCLLIVAYVMKMSIISKITLRRAGLILFHLGIPVMLAGYFAGKFGLDAEMHIPKGQSSNIIHTKDGRTEMLGFSIRCEGFDVIYNKDGSPAEFVSYLSFIKNGGVQKKSILRVNHPVSFEGTTLYQSAYACEETSIIKITDGSKTTWFKTGPGDEINPVKGVTVRTGQIFSDLMDTGPAVELFIETPDGSYNMWLLKNLRKIIERKPDFLESHREFDPALVKPFIFMLEGLNSSCTTGLSVRKDPGLILAASGGIMFAVGIIIIFIPRPEPEKRRA